MTARRRRGGARVIARPAHSLCPWSLCLLSSHRLSVRHPSAHPQQARHGSAGRRAKWNRSLACFCDGGQFGRHGDGATATGRPRAAGPGPGLCLAPSLRIAICYFSASRRGSKRQAHCERACAADVQPSRAAARLAAQAGGRRCARAAAAGFRAFSRPSCCHSAPVRVHSIRRCRVAAQRQIDYSECARSAALEPPATGRLSLRIPAAGGEFSRQRRDSSGGFFRHFH